MSKEIEKKWLIDYSFLKKYYNNIKKIYYITQFYTKITEYEEIRYRIKKHKYNKEYFKKKKKKKYNNFIFNNIKNIKFK
jgi:CYTH domain-containing protein